MSLSDTIQKDMTDAMRSKDAAVLSTLRMMRAAIKNKEVDKRGPLTDAEVQQVLSTLIKQRKDSIEQFTKGGRQELADKEAAEIQVIERYLPKEADEETLVQTVREAIAEMTSAAGSPSMKDMGTVMKAAMAKFAASGLRVDGKRVSELVRQELSKSS
jgi:uncharacterized protein YqeY